jgi:hypothetical protein
VYVAGKIALTVTLVWFAARQLRKRERAVRTLRLRLGREPTDEELFEYYLRESGR